MKEASCSPVVYEGDRGLEESESSSEKSECLERATSNDGRNYRIEDLRRDSIRY